MTFKEEKEAEDSGIQFFLASRLGNGHYFQQVAIRVLEVKASPAPALVDLAVSMAEWPAAVGEFPGLSSDIGNLSPLTNRQNAKSDKLAVCRTSHVCRHSQFAAVQLPVRADFNAVLKDSP